MNGESVEERMDLRENCGGIKDLDGSHGGLLVKNRPANAGDGGLIPGLGRSPGKGNGNPLQYSCWKSHGQRSLAGYSPRGSH